MLGTERGRTWLARWHRTTPSVRAAPRSLGSDTFNRDSMFLRSCSISSSSSSRCLEFCLTRGSAESLAGDKAQVEDEAMAKTAA